jgi:DNA repair exonuclease SbcCD ATPase subunit
MRKLQEQHDKDKKELQDTLNQANQANADARGDLDKMQNQIKELGDATAEEKAKIMADLEKSRKDAADSLAQSQTELDAIRGQLDAANQTIEAITTSLADAIAVITRLSEMIDAIISDGDVPQLEASLNEINTLLDNALLADTSSPGAGRPPPPPPRSGSSADDDDTPPPPPYDDNGPPPRPPPPRITFTDKEVGRNTIMMYGFPMEKIRNLDIDQLNKLNKIIVSDQNKTAQLKAMTADQIFDELNKMKGGRRRKGAGTRRKVGARKVTRRRKYSGGYVYKSGRSTRRSASSSSYQDGLSNYKRVQTRRRAVV